jgi:hypothetical protein
MEHTACPSQEQVQEHVPISGGSEVDLRAVRYQHDSREDDQKHDPQGILWRPGRC